MPLFHFPQGAALSVLALLGHLSRRKGKGYCASHSFVIQMGLYLFARPDMGAKKPLSR